MFGIAITATGLAVEAADTSVCKMQDVAAPIVTYPGNGVLDEHVLGCVVIASRGYEKLVFDPTYILYPHRKKAVLNGYRVGGCGVDPVPIAVPKTAYVGVLYTKASYKGDSDSVEVRGVYIPDGEVNGLQKWKLIELLGSPLNQADLPHVVSHSSQESKEMWLEVFPIEEIVVTITEVEP